MKKWTVLCLLLALTLVFAGCGSAPAQTEPAPAETPEPLPAEAPAPAQEPEASPQEEEAVSESAAHGDTLVVVFSATGTTRGVAERIAALTGADLAEIVPAQPYTPEDLDYGDRSHRATAEQDDPDARPEIANEISLEGYTTVYLGYPIWWGQAPRILSTFVESHDFTGITVVPFCTSGSSGAGHTGETLGEQAGTGAFHSSTRFASNVSDEELRAWIDDLP